MSRIICLIKPITAITSTNTLTRDDTAAAFDPHIAPPVGSANSPFLQWQVSCVLSLGVLLHWLERIRVCIIIDDFIGPGVGLYFYWT